jgi:hypothetical protein
MKKECYVMLSATHALADNIHFRSWLTPHETPI